MGDGGERVMLRAAWRPVEVLFVNHHARRGDDRFAHQDVVGTLGVPGATKEGAGPTTRAEAGLVLVCRRLEHDGAATEGGEVHDSRRPEGESLVGCHQRVGGGGAGRADR